MEIYQSTVTTKGQATIPQEIRKFLGISAGDTACFLLNEQTKKVEIVRRPDVDRDSVLDMARSFAPEWASPEDCAAFDHYTSQSRADMIKRD